MPTIFTKILAGEIPGQIIFEDEHCGAFLDINPWNVGHALIVPRMEVDYLFDLPSDVYAHLWSVAPKLAEAIKKATGCKRVGVAVEGFEVPHAHIHLIPLFSAKDYDPRMRAPANPADLAAMREKIVVEL